MKSRLLLTFMLFMALWGILFLRGAYLQLIPNTRLAQLQKRQFATKIEVNGRRGLIVDRNGRELAASVGSQSLFVDPGIIERPRTIAKRLSRVLKISQNELLKKIKQKDRRFVWLKRQLSDEEYRTIQKWEIRGLGFIEESRRVYPNNDLMRDVLGFVGVEGVGLEGLERKLNQELTGESRKVMLPRDARGRPLLPDGGLLTNVADGARIELSIDTQIQFILEKELQEAVKETLADSAVGIVMDPNTGEILAMSGQPNDEKRNRVISDSFEAGSVMKTFVIASALRDGQYKPSSKINCENGKMKIGDRWIREADVDHEFKTLTVSEILAFSSNVGTAKIALSLGAEKVRNTLIDFGFGEKLGADLPGETRGILHQLPWNPHLLSNISFGHGITVTPLQLASAYSAIANGGLLKKPFIVKKSIQEDRTEVTSSQTLRRVLSEEQAATMRIMLQEATMDHATGVNARIPGFPVAGKTGTAQKVDLEKGGYFKNAYVSSFAGFVPANAPRFVIVVSVDNPRKHYYASQVAAPIFSRIAQFVVRQQGLTPVLLSEGHLIDSTTRMQNQKKKVAQDIAIQGVAEELSRMNQEIVPSLQGLTLREVYQKAREGGYQVEIKGQGVVVNTFPGSGAQLPEDKKIRVFFERLE